MKKLFSVLSGILLICISSIAQRVVNTDAASIRLFNPTSSRMSAVVEIPTGSMATPGLIDWNNVRLESEGKQIPFSIREGKAHWRSSFKGAVKNPLPEDLLVFNHQVDPGKWAVITFVKGSSKTPSPLTRRKGNILVAYPRVTVSINEKTGMLSSILAFGDSLVIAPLQAQFFKVSEDVIEQHSSMNPGNTVPSLTLQKKEDIEMTKVELVSLHANQALTELNFILSHKNDIAIGLTYRIYPSGQIEIVSDERPWQNKSPWLTCGLEYRFNIQGEKKELEGFQTYFPYYGFKDYAASVKSIGDRYSLKNSVAYVFGEESINGRFWKRRIALFGTEAMDTESGIIDLLSEGFVVKADPVRSTPFPDELIIINDKDDSEIAGILAGGLSQTGIKVNTNENPTPANGSLYTITLQSDAPDNARITGDGFRITSSGNGIVINAGTKFGFYQAVVRFLRHLETEQNDNGGQNGKTAPLVSSNPVVDLRAGGFGGGPQEVDFPWGDETEWKNAIDGMLMSGMNSMTDLGMWSNWKMPVTFKYMPELMSTDPDAYDEVSGAKFSTIDSSREFALNLTKYIHERGGKVWLWIPVGAIPTTFEEKYPEATVPGKGKVPRFMHPEYRRYLESYFRELLETYPVDGFVLIRDDNGGIDDTEEFKEYLANSKTKDRVWEQYIVLHKLIRDLNFKGTIAVYPYFDLYKPNIEELIPEDIVIVGHGSGIGVLTRDYETLGTMGDTWLDNLFVAFRVPSMQRMKRLLSDRGSYWIGGAYTAMELPWEAIGYFGWEPTATVNSFRYGFGSRMFGEDQAAGFVSFSEASDNLWEIMNVWLFPPRWFSLTKQEQARITGEGERGLSEYRRHLATLKPKSNTPLNQRWLDQADLYATYFSYHLQRANLSSKIESIALSHLNYCSMGASLPESVRQQVISLNDSIYRLADQLDTHMAETSGDMPAVTLARHYNRPFREMVYGYVGYPKTVDQLVSVRQFNANLAPIVTPLVPGQPFEIQVEIRNTGFMPWMKEHGFELKLVQGGDKFSISGIERFINDPVVFGDTLLLTLRGTAPPDHGSEEVKIALLTAFRGGRQPVAEHTVLLKW